MLLYWRKFDKVEKEHRRKAEKEAIEQKRHDEEMREVNYEFSLKKLNFLFFGGILWSRFQGYTVIVAVFDCPIFSTIFTF